MREVLRWVMMMLASCSWVGHFSWMGLFAWEVASADEAAVVEQLRISSQTYSTEKTWSERREQIKTEFLKGVGLWPLPERPPVKAIRYGLRDHDGYSVENVALETIPGFYCTGNLYQPLGRKDLAPLILCPHGHVRPWGRMGEEQQLLCGHLARMGATVFSYSMVGWQDSKQTTHDDPIVLALQTWNSLRAVDFLTGLERVDPQRVGVTGASGGGTQAMYLSLIDERVKASAPIVIVYPWSCPDGCLCEGGMPVMQVARTNAIEIAAATSPRSQLLISVGTDNTKTFPRIGWPFVQQMYRVAGSIDKVSHLHFAEEGHDFGPSKRRAVYKFFAEHLSMEPNLFQKGPPNKTDISYPSEEDQRRIKVESPEQLAVFDEKHPLPTNALQGGEDIAKAFSKYLSDLRQSQPATLRISDGRPAEYSFREATSEDEKLLFTPSGFDRVGTTQVASGPMTARLKVVVRDAATGKPTYCRLNVVGPDGNFYQPRDNALNEHSLNGNWPKSGWGNRPGKAPYRYLGRYFYCDGKADVQVPVGAIRVEVWKGFEYRPTTTTIGVVAGDERDVEIFIERTISMMDEGYWSGDPHVHIPRRDDSDDRRIFDLLEADDIHFSTILGYNEPAGPYTGLMQSMEAPQFRRLGERSNRTRGLYAITSGQEYRSGTYGHLNLFGLDDLVLPGQTVNANHWPPYGHIIRDARSEGGFAFYAHGGYAQAIYADVAQGFLDGVELFQFGVYRGIGLIDWYHMLNAGFKVPATGASDYPACRKLGDCLTYVEPTGVSTKNKRASKLPGMKDWLRGLANGRSFVTNGPLLLLDVDGHRPGDVINLDKPEPYRITARLRVRCDVAPITNVQLIANGRILRELELPISAGQSHWIELQEKIELTEPAWIAARAFSLSSQGTPDAEGHTNPIYVHLNGKKPYQQSSVHVLLKAVEAQIEAHRKRSFPEQAAVLEYFERSRNILIALRDKEDVSSTGQLTDQSSDVSQSKIPTFDPSRLDHTEDELREFLKPLPPQSVPEAVKAFETLSGFTMQPVAAEPLVTDPIVACFDERGDLYVCEMRDYPYKPQAGQRPIGLLRKLIDTDGDGDFDKSYVFADELLWSGGVAAWQGGVFVTAPPDIWYMKDTDGDHRADIRRRVYTGFGSQNQQGMLNNLTWGFDHWIYGSTAGNGGDIRPADQPNATAIDVRGRDFRFDPVSGKFETTTGTRQFGTTFDDWGRRFLCSESQPLYHVVLPEHYLARNPNLTVPNGFANIAQGPVTIFRISPLETWRMIRSSRRIATGARLPTVPGASHHVVDAGAGVTIYRGGAYPPEFYGQVFIGDSQNNLIHRRMLVPDGVTFLSKRIDEETEFVRTTDNWFRPVNFVNAPDGTLYVLDMSREVVESIHIPDDVVKFLDLKSGRDRGRIYRIAPPGFQYPGPPRLDQATTEELVAELASPHGWRRDTAHRLLYERQDPKAIPGLRCLLFESQKPQARLLALWSLEGLNALSNEDCERGLSDDHPGIRENALQLCESRLDKSPSLLTITIRLCDDIEPRVRFQAAFSLGASHDRRAATALTQLARTSVDDTWMNSAILSSTYEFAEPMLVELIKDDKFTNRASGLKFLDALANCVGSRNDHSQIVRILDELATLSESKLHAQLQQRMVIAIGKASSRLGTSLDIESFPSLATKKLLDGLIQNAIRSAFNSDAPEAERLQAIRLLGCFAFEVSEKTLGAMHDTQQPEVIQLGAIGALADYRNPKVSTMLLSGWQSQGPSVRKTIAEAMLSRADRTEAFLQAALSGKVSVALLDQSQRELMLKHREPAVRQLAEQLFGGDAPRPRKDVLVMYQPALTTSGDKILGEQVFKKNCMACHKIGDVGFAIGPDLASSPSKDASALLTHVLDPNQFVLPTFEQYVVMDINGNLYSGTIAAQSANSVTLKREENKTDIILRSQIEEMKGTGKSLMPEGLEKVINVSEMADLIAFLQGVGTSNAVATGVPLPIGTLPGLVEPKSN